MPTISCPREMPNRTAARTAAFIPGARPPACTMAIRVPCPGNMGSGWAIPSKTRSMPVNESPRAFIAPW